MYTTPSQFHRFPQVIAMAAGLAFTAQGAFAGDLPAGADAALHAQVPQEYMDGVVAVYDPQYPPSYFIDDSGEMVGYVLDFQKAIATKLGIPVKSESSKFAGIIAGILSERYDMSYFHDSEERRLKMDIVDFQQTGTAVMVKKGNPNNLDLHDLCGHKIGVATGSKQGLELVPRLQEECTSNGKSEFEVLNFAGPNEGSLAVKTGRIDGWLDGAPYAGYMVRQNEDLFEKAPTADLSGVSGFAFRKGDPMAKVFKAAAEALIADGTYQEILNDWHIGELALPAPMINGE